MTFSSQLLSYGLWISHPVLQLAAAIVMWHRGLRRQFPIFFAYLLAEVGIFAIIFPLQLWGSYGQYFYAYWVGMGLGLALGFKVIQEIFMDVFRPYHALKDLGNVLFKWASIVMLIVAVVVAAASTASDQGPLVQAISTVQRCLRLMQLGLVLFLVIFARYLGVSWKQSSFGISLGFGIFAAAELMGSSLGASGAIGEHTLNLALASSYSLTLGLWIGYFQIKHAPREAVLPLTSQRWDESLVGMNQPGTTDSLIPMFEGMVDRALSRNREAQVHLEAEAGPARKLGPRSAPGKALKSR